MDQIVQLLFNPNHQAPSPLVLAVLVALAVGMPPIMRYLAGKSNNDNTRGKKLPLYLVSRRQGRPPLRKRGA